MYAAQKRRGGQGGVEGLRGNGGVCEPMSVHRSDPAVAGLTSVRQMAPSVLIR